MEYTIRKNNGWWVYRTLNNHFHQEFQTHKNIISEKIHAFVKSGYMQVRCINQIKALRPDLLHPQ